MENWPSSPPDRQSFIDRAMSFSRSTCFRQQIVRCVCALLIFLTPAMSQSDAPSARHVVYGELATSIVSVSGSLNYEFMLTPSHSVRFGYGMAHRSWGFTRGMDAKGMTVMVQNISLVAPHHFEIGGGISIMKILARSEPFHQFLWYRLSADSWSFTPAVAAGYRYQPNHGGVFLRIGVTAILLFGVPMQISAGYAF